MPLEITFYKQQDDHSVVCLSVLVMCTAWQPASKADYVGAVCPLCKPCSVSIEA